MSGNIRKVQLEYGLRGDKVIFVSELTDLERGKACNCICPVCRKQLVAKLGPHNQWHFAHDGAECNLVAAQQTALHKDAYRAKQESSLILHEAAVKTLKAAGVTKLPNLAAMQEEYGKLQAQKEALYADYGKLKKQVKEYDVIKQNIDNILRQGKEPERKKGKERE